MKDVRIGEAVRWAAAAIAVVICAYALCSLAEASDDDVDAGPLAAGCIKVGRYSVLHHRCLVWEGESPRTPCSLGNCPFWEGESPRTPVYSHCYGSCQRDVFSSYQWPSWGQVGSVSIQFNAVTESLKIIAASLRMGMEGIYMWSYLWSASALSQCAVTSEEPRTQAAAGLAVPQDLTYGRISYHGIGMEVMPAGPQLRAVGSCRVQDSRRLGLPVAC